MNHSDFPSLDEIYREAERLADGNPDIVRMESLGVSAEGRDVKAVYVTDSSVPASEKEVAIVVCGRHGNELGTRVVGNALLRWLASAEGQETRRRQLVIVVPVANPDGCVREEFFAPGDGLSETEHNTIAELAWAYQPDAVVDVHSLGQGDTEAIITANTSAAGEDVFIHRQIAATMAAAAAREGYPFVVHAVGLSGGYNNFFCGMCYEEFHSLAFGMEVNHCSLKPEEAAESAVAAIRSLLGAGNTRWAWEPASGYPNRTLLGDSLTSIRAAGGDAAQRRDSRSTIWQSRASFAVPAREARDSQTVRVVTEYSGGAVPCGFSLCCRVRGSLVIEKVRLNGGDVDAHTYSDDCSTYVCVDIHPSGSEEYELRVEL